MGVMEIPGGLVELRDEERLRRQTSANRLVRPVRRLKVVCIGGGTGLPVVLRGLSRRVLTRAGEERLALTAVVAMSDDGGSSGRLRRHLGALPPGDVRNCLVALAGHDSKLRGLLQHRLSGSRALSGHAVGNLMLAGLAELTGDFVEGVRVLGELLGARGTVLPSTLERVRLTAVKDGGVQIQGERNLCRTPGAVRRVSLIPTAPMPSPGLIEAIRDADLVTIGPGSLFSSALPNLLVEGVAKALQETSALRVLVANLMTQPGETDDMDCAAHVRAITSHVGPVLDAVLVNAAPIPHSLLLDYAVKGSVPVTVDRRAVLEAGVAPIEADLLRRGSRVRHDSGKVARCLLRLAQHGL